MQVIIEANLKSFLEFYAKTFPNSGEFMLLYFIIGITLYTLIMLSQDGRPEITLKSIMFICFWPFYFLIVTMAEIGKMIILGIFIYILINLF